MWHSQNGKIHPKYINLKHSCAYKHQNLLSDGMWLLTQWSFWKAESIWWFKIPTASLCYIYFNSKNIFFFIYIRLLNVIQPLWYEYNKSIFVLYCCWQTIYEAPMTSFFIFFDWSHMTNQPTLLEAFDKVVGFAFH